MPEISKKIINNIINSEAYQNAHSIMIFYPLKYEINLLPLLNIAPDKQFFLPRMSGNTLEVCPYNGNDKLVCSKYQIFEPVTQPVDKNLIDIIFIPALCTDKNFNRLGYGKGFYDNLLRDYNKLKICVCPEELVFDNIPYENHDIKMNFIITQKEIYKK